MLLSSERISTSIKSMTLAICLLVIGAPPSYAQSSKSAPSVANSEQELLNLSKQKWDWMSERNVDALAALFHDQSVFVHMGATMSKTQELDVIKAGRFSTRRQIFKKRQ